MANEISATVAVYEVKVAPLGVSNIVSQLPSLNIYPNPVQKGQLYFSATISGTLVDMNGHAVTSFNNANSINVTNLAAGVYFLNAEGYSVEKVIVQ